MQSEPKTVDKLLVALLYRLGNVGSSISLRKSASDPDLWTLKTVGGIFSQEAQVEEFDARMLYRTFARLNVGAVEVTAASLHAYFEGLSSKRRVFAMDTSQSTTQRQVSLFQDGSRVCTLMNAVSVGPGAPAMVVRDGVAVWDLYDPEELCQRWSDLALAHVEQNGQFPPGKEGESKAVALYSEAINSMSVLSLKLQADDVATTEPMRP